MRAIDFFECSACGKTFQCARNSKRHVESVCHGATVSRVPMVYAICDEAMDIETFLQERKIPFPGVATSGPAIRDLVAAWSPSVLEKCVKGDILDQLRRVFDFTWSKSNTAVPKLQNVFRHNGTVYVLQSTQTLTDTGAPPEIVRLPDVVETYRELAHRLFVTHREFVVSTRFDKLFADPSIWDAYATRALPGLQTHVLAEGVDGYQSWMDPIVDLVRRGIPTYNGPPVAGGSDTITVGMCNGCGWSHPDASKTKRHIASCHHARRRGDAAGPVRMRATVSRFDGADTKLATRKRRLDEDAYTLDHTPAGCNVERARRTYTSDQLEKIVPDDLGSLTDASFQDGIVRAFDHLFGSRAVDPAFRAFFKRDGHVTGYVAAPGGNEHGTLQRVSPLEIVNVTIDTIFAVWNKATCHRHAFSLLEWQTKTIDGMSIQNLQSAIDTFRPYPDRHAWWVNLTVRILDTIPCQSDV